MGKKDPAEDRAELREGEPETTDDLETAEAKSRSVDERVPEHFATDDAVGVGPPAQGVPQAGIGLPRPGVEPGEGEKILDLERKAQRAPKQPG